MWIGISERVSSSFWKTARLITGKRYWAARSATSSWTVVPPLWTRWTVRGIASHSSCWNNREAIKIERDVWVANYKGITDADSHILPLRESEKAILPSCFTGLWNSGILLWNRARCTRRLTEFSISQISIIRGKIIFAFLLFENFILLLLKKHRILFIVKYWFYLCTGSATRGRTSNCSALCLNLLFHQ